MNINFANADENFIKRKVEDGYYSNATELVRDAVRRMREVEDKKHARLLAALAEGERDVAAGRVVPYGPGFLDDCAARARENVAQGKRLNPDVLP